MGRTLTQRTGGPMGETPLWIEGANADKAARLIRMAARELVELKFPLRTLWALWKQTQEQGSTAERLAAIGRTIWRLATVGLGAQERVLLDQLSRMTFVGDQGVFRFDGLEHPLKQTTPRVRSPQGRTA